MLVSWLGWQLLRQNGRFLLRLEELEQRLDEIEFGEGGEAAGPAGPGSGPAGESGEARGLVPPYGQPAEDGRNGLDGRAGRFSRRSLARSRIPRDGLKAGTPAPDFTLPRLDGRGDLSLAELRGRRVLLVFSDPHCGPCSALAPELERFHRRNDAPPSPRPAPAGEGEASPALAVVMISRGEPAENRAKVKEHGLTFPIILQQQWEISRRYAMFATPMAYLIDGEGIIAREVAVGLEPIRTLLEDLARPGVPASSFTGDAAPLGKRTDGEAGWRNGHGQANEAPPSA